MKTTATYRLEIRSAEGEPIPSVIRLRAVLKQLLRAYGFTVTRLVSGTDGTDETQEGET